MVNHIREDFCERRFTAMICFLRVVSSCALFHGADVAGVERATVFYAVIGRVVKDLQALGVQVTHASMPMVGFSLFRHGHCFVSWGGSVNSKV